MLKKLRTSFRYNCSVKITVFILAHFTAASQANSASTRFLDYLDDKDILAFGICRNIKNYNEAGQMMLVPSSSEDEWRSFIGNPPKGAGISECVHPCKTEGIGTECIDGAVYAGTLDDRRIYAAPVMEDEFLWNAGTLNFARSGAVSLSDGKSNTDMLVGRSRAGAEFDAALICQQKGKEWYLPALSELNVIAANYKNILGSEQEEIREISGRYFWSSTEASTDSAYATVFNESRVFTPVIKAAPLPVWCIRKELQLEEP